MQERYLGDSHDFVKYALLREIGAKSNLSIGMNWYLARPEHVDQPSNNDGEKRHHLKGGVWEDWDFDLFHKMKEFELPSERSLEKLESLNVLPKNTAFFGEYLSQENRSFWHSKALEKLSVSDVVFLDPDNGFEVKSMTQRTGPKYAFYSEAFDYYGRGQSVVCIQFARQCDPKKRAGEIRSKIKAAFGDIEDPLVLRGRVAPNILFICIPQKKHRIFFELGLKSVTEKSGGKAEIV